MKISIVGQITDTKFDGCFSPIDLKEQLEGVDANEPLEVEITSEGGSVFAGIQIANILSRHNGKVTTHAVGLCASIATVILMAGEKVVVDDNCFCLIHLPWSYCEGNANDMMKEIDTLKKCEAAMMGYYRKHSKIDDETLSKYINEETWFLGSEFADVFDVEVLECDQVMNIAARFDLNKFNKVDKRISIMNKNNEEVVEEQTIEEEKKEEVVEEQKTVEEQPKEDTPTEEEKPVVEEEEKKEDEPSEDEPTPEEMKEEIATLKNRIAELEKELEEAKATCEPEKKDEEVEEEEKVTKEECEKRVSGMQASMQKQVNDFKSAVELKDKELKDAKASIINLNERLDNATKELTSMASALADKTQALEMLNSSVNAPSEELPTMNDGLAKCLTPSEKVAFLKSGKYVR